MNWRHSLYVAFCLSRMRVKTQMEYRAGFFLDRIAQIVSYGASFGTLWILLERFGTLGGWTWPELALLLSFQLLNYALGASVSLVQMRDLEELIARGTLDGIMVKPVNTWIYVVFEGFNAVGYSGHIVLAAALMIWSLTQVPVSLDIWSVLFLLGSIASASAIVAALITMIGATAMRAVRARYLYPIFFGLWELTRYPPNILPGGLVLVLVTIVPLGYLSFVPVAFLLGKDIPVLGVWGGLGSLLMGPALIVLARVYWKYSVQGYQGAGG